MEQNLGRARSISQSPAAQIAAVSTVTSSLLTRAMLNVSHFSHKSSVRAVCTHRQRNLTSPYPCTSLLLTSNNSWIALVLRASQRHVPRAAVQGPNLTMVSIGHHAFQTASVALWLTSHGKINWKTRFCKTQHLQDPHQLPSCFMLLAHLFSSHYSVCNQRFVI